jgi:hypothetical protein
MHAKLREITTLMHNKIVHMITMPLKLRFTGIPTQLKKVSKGLQTPNMEHSITVLIIAPPKANQT